MPSIKIENPFLVSCWKFTMNFIKKIPFFPVKKAATYRLATIDIDGLWRTLLCGAVASKKIKKLRVLKLPGARLTRCGTRAYDDWMMIGWKHFGKFHIRKLRLGFFSRIMFQQQMDRFFFCISWKKNGVWNILLWICWSHLFNSRYYSDFNNSSTHFSWKMLWSCMQL